MRTFPLSALPNSSIFNKIIAQLFNNLCWIRHDKCTFWCSILCRMHKTSLTGQFQTCRNSSELQPASGLRWRPSFRRLTNRVTNAQCLINWWVGDLVVIETIKNLFFFYSDCHRSHYVRSSLPGGTFGAIAQAPLRLYCTWIGCCKLLNVISITAWSLV